MSDVSGLAHLACAGAAAAAGVVNAVAGGGTLISFPVMTAVGVPAVRANATNTVSLCPGYISGTYAQRRDLEGLAGHVRPQLVVAAFGGLLGSVLLVVTSESVFRAVVPYLILAAAVLLALQNRLRAWVAERRHDNDHPRRTVELLTIGAAAIYGGYFGAGLGIMLMAVLGLFSDLPFTRLNAVKQLLSFVINVCAAAFLVFSGKIEWILVAVMSPCSLLGGQIGGRVAGSLPPERLRAGVIVFAFAVAVVYLVR